MNKVSRNKENIFLISKKKLFNIDFNPKMPFSFNKEQKRNLFNEGCEKIKLISNNKEETSLPVVEERNDMKNNFLGKKVKFKVYNEIVLKRNKKFITTRFQKKPNRWNKNERYIFLEGLFKYGCNWKAIKKHIKSRSPKQVRSHAQKLILKLKKFKDDSLGIDFTKDSDKDKREIVNKLKEIIDNSNDTNIINILSQKLSTKKVSGKSTKKETLNYNKLIACSKDILSKDEYLNSNILYVHDNNYNINKIEDNSIKIKDNVDEMRKKINEDYEKTVLRDFKINHNELSQMIPNKIGLRDCSLEKKHIENDKANPFNNIILDKKNKDNKTKYFLDALEEIKNYWNFNGKINLLENENDEQGETIFETNSFNLLKNYYNNEI